MTIYSITRIAAAALAAAGMASAAQAAAFTNGSFEDPILDYQDIAGGNAVALPGWTTVLSGIEHFRPTTYLGGTFVAAADGLMVVDLAHVSDNSGGLEQTFDTLLNQHYTVSFHAGNSNAFGRTGTGDVLVSLNGGPSLVFATPAAGTAALVWGVNSFNFQASGTQTTLRFWNDQDANTHFAMLDNVSVTAVPEPETYAMMLAGLGALGFMARRRKVT